MQYVKHLAALKYKVLVSEKHLRPPSNQVPAPVLQTVPEVMRSLNNYIRYTGSPP